MTDAGFASGERYRATFKARVAAHGQKSFLFVLVRPKGRAPAEWLEAVGLGDEQNARPESLSGGMRRRLALARCLAYGEDKALLLLDEPFTGVDAERIRSLIALIRAMDIPTIFTAHDAESLLMADRVVELTRQG